MKKNFFLGITFSFLCVGPNAFAGEITDMEWNILDNIVVTYYSGTSAIVNCTAFNSKNKPIGGGNAISMGGVARVQIDVPTKYEGK